MYKKKMTFAIGFKYDKEYGGYITKVLNLPGCMSQGKTREEAQKNTLDAINVCLAVRAKEMQDFQKAVLVDTILKQGENSLYKTC